MPFPPKVQVVDEERIRPGYWLILYVLLSDASDWCQEGHPVTKKQYQE